MVRGRVVIDDIARADGRILVVHVIHGAIAESADDGVARAAVVPDAVGGIGDRAGEGDVRDELARLDVVDEGMARAQRQSARGRAVGVAHGQAAHRAVDVVEGRPRGIDRAVGPGHGPIGGRALEEEAVDESRSPRSRSCRRAGPDLRPGCSLHRHWSRGAGVVDGIARPLCR